MKIEFKAVGIVRSPFKTVEGMPIQPTRAKGIEGTIEVFPEYAASLKDLDGFSHIFVLYHFHKAGPYRPLVVPFLDKEERGLFATRAPTRPSPMGLSVLEVRGVEGSVVRVSDVDILDGTPVLDIKPYVAEFDCRPDARSGWIETARRGAGTILSDDRFK